jgi:hypothetical protein
LTRVGSPVRVKKFRRSFGRLVSQLTFMHSRPRYQCTGADAWRSRMTAIERVLSRAIVTINGNEILKQIVLLCAAGLFVSLLMLTYGVDLSPGFF